MGPDENTLNEIEQEMICYLLNVDDMNYTMLCEVCKEDGLESIEFIDTQVQIEFPKRKFHPLRPTTMEDELAKESSYSE